MDEEKKTEQEDRSGKKNSRSQPQGKEEIFREEKEVSKREPDVPFWKWA